MAMRKNQTQNWGLLHLLKKGRNMFESKRSPWEAPGAMTDATDVDATDGS